MSHVHRLNPLLSVLFLTTVSLTPAYANLIGNGSFETPVIGADFQVFGTGVAVGDWTVQFDSVDIVRNNILGTDIVAQDGNQWLDLNGLDRGGVFQFITTVPGEAYDFRFWYADNPFSNIQGSQLGVPKTGAWTIRDGGTNALLLPLGNFTHSTTTGTDADWRDSGLIRFIATSVSTRIAFSGDLTMASTGPMIDNVSVDAVPEPGVTWLFGAGVVAAGYFRRRR